MIKIIKLISAPLLSFVMLMSLTSVGNAETTVSAEVGFIFNTLLFLICGFLVELEETQEQVNKSKSLLLKK